MPQAVWSSDVMKYWYLGNTKHMFYQVRLVQYQMFVSLSFDGDRRMQGFNNWKLS